MKPNSLQIPMLLGLSLVVSIARGDDPAAPDVKPVFDELLVKIEAFEVQLNAQVEQLRIESTGRCWYEVQGSEATANTPARAGARFGHWPSSDRIQRLNKLLEETQWLTADGAEGRARQLHPSTVRLTLKRDGVEKSIVCEGQRPAPYAALLHELQGIAVQERRIYLHDYVAGRDGRDAWQEVGRELAALRGEPYAKSLYEIEYDRYLPIARRIIRDFHGKLDEDLIPAIRLIGYLKADSELPFVHRLADDRSSRVRTEVALTLGMIHDVDSLPILVKMMSASGTRREVGFQLIAWGDDAVPDIVKLIEQSTDSSGEARTRTTGEDMIRAYIDHWSKVPRVDPAVIDTVTRTLQAKDPQNGLIRTTYHIEFLKLVAAAQ